PWKEKLEEQNLAGLDAAARRGLLDELLPAVKSFTAGRAGIWKRLETLRETADDASSARYRTDIRLATLLRMRAVLTRIAGTQLLEDPETAAPTALAAGSGTKKKPRSPREAELRDPMSPESAPPLE